MKNIDTKTFDKNYNTFDENQLKEIFKVGTKFRCVGDDDPWYIVGILPDGVDVMLVVYKSWTKYKKRWIYKVQNVWSLLWEISLKGGLFEDNNGNLVIKDVKK